MMHSFDINSFLLMAILILMLALFVLGPIMESHHFNRDEKERAARRKTLQPALRDARNKIIEWGMHPMHGVYFLQQLDNADSVGRVEAILDEAVRVAMKPAGKRVLLPNAQPFAFHPESAHALGTTDAADMPGKE